MIKHSLKFLAAGAVVLLAACGSSDNGPSFASAADSATIDLLSNDAGDFVQTALNNVYGSQGFGIPLLAPSATSTPQAQAFVQAYVARVRRLVELKQAGAFPTRPAFSPSLSAPFSTCTPTETGIDTLGDPIDTDGDGIPDDYRVNFGSACVDEDSAGTSRTTISGSIRLQDTDAGFLSFHITVSNIKIKEENLATGDFFQESLNGSETGAFAAALASHTMNLAVGVTAKTGETTISITENASETSSFDPDGAGTLTLGGDLPAGNFAYTGDLKLVGENSGGEVPGNFHIALSTPTPMHFNPACGSDIDGGVFRGLLNGDSSIGFTLTWSSCSAPVLDVFGDTAPAAVAAR